MLHRVFRPLQGQEGGPRDGLLLLGQAEYLLRGGAQESLA